MPPPFPLRETEYSRGWQGLKAHPDAPDGGSGPGFSRPQHSHEEKSLWGGVTEFFDAAVHGIENVGERAYHVADDAVHGVASMEESCWNVYYALQRAVEYSPSSIRESTGFFLEELAKGLLQAILFSVAILVLSAGIGAVAGGILAGILSAGGGTPFGVATGAELGTDVGLVLLDWLGLGFLIVYVTQHIDRVTTLARRGVGIAWEAGRNPDHSKQAEIDAAARVLSQAMGEFFALLLQAILAFVMKEVGTSILEGVMRSERFATVLAGLVETLKRSKLGEGFAIFIEKNFAKILDNARRKQKAEVDAGGGGSRGSGEGGGGTSGSRGRSQAVGQGRPSEAISPPTSVGNADAPPTNEPEAIETESPGQWRDVSESMSDRAADYQSQITGEAPGRVYDVDAVKFDGYKDGTLLDAKGPGYEKFVDKTGEFKPWYRGADELVDQAERQLNAAGDTPIEWHVAEESAANAIRSLLEREGLGQITVIFDPPL